ncbi:hypothetical protein AOL_s00110g149 [Orbilia oligospora ATCC 24927]|uniref:NACHT domain-containing protein n=1 Tax=Arthrobotrys oligospora (strain ATCC 24927 / CBS 115.81 / DSM 1491) TaxID=756982 RepID=G1XKX9_ARTOA|nr:hypothetical protein AOL_s00110g149 [Orbilia oligospora ATCC 24927]EGX46325.1 hypothetical protein AOL_s00110g149 [Orbilia oligospora ATCC 24927]
MAEYSRPTERSQAIFNGVGIQNSGNISVGRDLVIGPNDSEFDADRCCLNDLRVTDPRHDKQRIESVKGGLLADAYTWILRNTEFKEWHGKCNNYNYNDRLLWIKGDPGKGKTMLLCGIIDELNKPTGDVKFDNFAFFFCQATDERLNNATAVLRGLIFLLVSKQPALLSHVRKKYDSAGRNSGLFQDSNAFFALSEIFTDIMQDPALKSTCLIIDALDECVVDLPWLLKLIVEKLSVSTTANSRLRWIVSSRNWWNIEKVLNTAAQGINLSLELNADSISTAVTAYIQHKVDKLGYRSKLRDTVSQYLLANAQSTFLWVALVCQELQNVPQLRVQKKLQEFPPGLDMLYRRMVEQIYNSGDAKSCESVVAVMLVVRRPITLEELTTLVDIPDLESDDDLNSESLREIVQLCGSFLTVRDGVISFVHQSAKDYLVKNESLQMFPDGRVEKQEQLMVLRLICAMEKTLTKNIYGLETLDFDILKDKTEPPNPDPLASLRYACLHWIDHVCGTEDSWRGDFLSNNGRVLGFLRKHLLHWLEALSLLKAVTSGVQAIAKLNLFLPKVVPAQSQTSRLVYDANRFVLHNKEIVERFPRQIYVSALLFSPVKSLTRKLFEAENLDWVTIKPAVETDWGACLQTFHGHDSEIASVTISSNGMCIASGSLDGTIKIWDVNGNCLNTFGGNNCPIRSVAISDNGHIASGSDHETIKIWDFNGNLLKTLHGDESEVISVAFSNNGCIISGSDDGTIKIWDFNGNLLKTLHGHESEVASVAFSNDGRIASSLWGGTIKIWDFNGNLLKTLHCHESGVASVAFSNDGHIASVSRDETIKIWDSSGNCINTLIGHYDSITSVVFSKDCTRIISGSRDGNIKIWDITGNSCNNNPHHHHDRVGVVGLSKSGTQIASGSFDDTIKIWDLDGNCISTLRHGGLANLITFSNNGARMVSSSFYRGMKVWDINNNICLSTFRHESWITSVTFSNNDTLLAVGSDDGSIKILNINGDCLNILHNDRGEIQSVAFSKDERFIASISREGTIQIWKIKDKFASEIQFEGRLTGGSHKLTILAFDNTKWLGGRLINWHLLTDTVDISMDMGLSFSPVTIASPQSLGVSSSGEWVTLGGRHVVWLPLEYQATCFVTRGNAIAFGCASGRPNQLGGFIDTEIAQAVS